MQKSDIVLPQISNYRGWPYLKYAPQIYISFILFIIISLRLAFFLNILIPSNYLKDLSVPQYNYTPTPSGRGYAYDPHDYLFLAGQIEKGMGYTYPDGNATTFRPPLYPLLLSSFASGFKKLSTLPLWANFLMSSFSILLFSLYLSKNGFLFPAICAAFLFSINTSWGEADAHIQYEPFLIFTLITAVYMAANVNCLKGSHFSLLTGVFLGFSALINPSILIALFIYILILWLMKISKKKISLVLVGAFVVVLPWTTRNLLTTGTFVMISSNGGMNLYIGNNSDNIVLSGQIYSSRVLNNIRQTSLSVSEISIDRSFYKKALQYIKNHPYLFLKRSLYKSWLFVYAASTLLANNLIATQLFWIILTITFAIMGGLIAIHAKDTGLILVIAILLSGVVIYSTHWFWWRMVLPYFPFYGLLVFTGASETFKLIKDTSFLGQTNISKIRASEKKNYPKRKP